MISEERSVRELLTEVGADTHRDVVEIDEQRGVWRVDEGSGDGVGSSGDGAGASVDKSALRTRGGLEAGVRVWRPFMNFSAGCLLCASRDRLSRHLREEPAARANMPASVVRRGDPTGRGGVLTSPRTSRRCSVPLLARAIARPEIHAFSGPEVAHNLYIRAATRKGVTRWKERVIDSHAARMAFLKQAAIDFGLTARHIPMALRITRFGLCPSHSP